MESGVEEETERTRWRVEWRGDREKEIEAGRVGWRGAQGGGDGEVGREAVRVG